MLKCIQEFTYCASDGHACKLGQYQSSVPNFYASIVLPNILISVQITILLSAPQMKMKQCASYRYCFIIYGK